MTSHHRDRQGAVNAPSVARASIAGARNASLAPPGYQPR